MINKLVDQINNPNIAKKLSASKIAELSDVAIFGYDLDESSREDWKKQTEEGLKIAEQVMEKKDFPWEGAANVKFPLIAISAIQFAARAMPTIIQGNNIVKAQVVGEDKDGLKAERAKRVSDHMSYQLSDGIPDWVDGTDKLLHALPVVGTMFRKTYYDSLEQQNTSELCMPLDVVVHMKTKSLETCRRISHKIYLYKNDVMERELDGIFLPLEANYMTNQDDEIDEAELFIEQHRWYDLDGDGYQEPYIATIHYDSKQLVRLVARYDEENILTNAAGKVRKIIATQYFTAYFFLPAPSGKFYALGFAHLLGPINESLNTIINQLLDSGTMANLQSGFIGKGISWRGGTLSFKPGEWKVVDTMGATIKENIVPLPAKPPSTVLFQLLGMLHDNGMKLASVSETMAGESPSQNTPATTTLAVIEQGLKVFTAIYGRIFRSLKQEFKKLYRLNSKYMDEEEYYTVLDTNSKVFQKDYEVQDLDVIPVADPSVSSEAQRMARAEALMKTYEINPTPEGKIEILLQFYKAISASRLDKLMPEDKIKKQLESPPPPNPDIEKIKLQAIQQAHDYDFAREEHDLKMVKLKADIAETESRTVKNLAEAESKPIMNQLEVLNSQVKAIHDRIYIDVEREKIDASRLANQQRGAAGVAKSPNQQEGSQVLPESPGQLEGNSLSGGITIPTDRTANSTPGGTDQGSQPYPTDTTRVG